MKIKTSELIGSALDWVVAKIEGVAVEPNLDVRGDPHGLWKYRPSAYWAQGGPIIERELIRYNKKGGDFYAWTPDHDYLDPLHEPLIEGLEGVKWRGFDYGPTLLTAAMRCYVASRLGDEVEVPDNLGASTY